MTHEELRLIAVALLAYAELTEKSPMRHYVPEGTKRTAAQCRELANYFVPGIAEGEKKESP